mgnify:CR=1 FL=1
MAADVIAEQVGRLAFQVDERGLDKFQAGMKAAGKDSDFFGSKAVALGTALGNLASKAASMAVDVVTELAGGDLSGVTVAVLGAAPDRPDRGAVATPPDGGQAGVRVHGHRRPDRRQRGQAGRHGLLRLGAWSGGAYRAPRIQRRPSCSTHADRRACIEGLAEIYRTLLIGQADAVLALACVA